MKFLSLIGLALVAIGGALINRTLKQDPYSRLTDAEANTLRCKWWVDILISRKEPVEYVCTMRDYDEWTRVAEKVIGWCGADCGVDICEHELLAP